ncbi:hypothetical protein INT43_007406 [Umbelopsis isabellina]|uniref:RBR-type E3 ubiquitin transferase n=1 Tax=Mortierella isabellina TaxID=91625 RepID=A0A8H7Q0I5_MORIS|nr:hypothetical protein INT43_007406 [Umbelopsis isabellina]
MLYLIRVVILTQQQSIFTQQFIYEYHQSTEGYKIASGTLSVNTELPNHAVKVHIGGDCMTLHYLPPVALEFTMPSGYPMQQNCEIAVKCVWLNQHQIAALEEKLDYIWQNEKNVVYLENGKHLKLHHHQISLIANGISTEVILSGVTLQTILQQHEKSSLQDIFSHTSFVCGICMEEKKGESCTQLDKCGHVFCKVCLAGYFSMLIREGLISQVRCPDLECSQNKEGGNEPPSREQLILITGEDLANRYDRLLLQQQHQLDPQITFCPRLQCQEPVRKDPNYEKLCYCTACGYAFCLLCQKTWHGPQMFCQFKNTPKIIKEYLDVEDNPEQIAHLEAKYVVAYLWRKRLDAMHFNSQGTLCHMRLFEGVADVDVFDDFLPPFDL